ITGEEVYYAGGGGGGGHNYGTAPLNNGGLGGGGNGVRNKSVQERMVNVLPDDGRTEYEAECGVDGLGGGGGGGNNTGGDYKGRPGGCGCVIFRLSNVSASSPVPVVAFLGQTATAFNSASFECSLLNPGAGCDGEGVDLSVQYSLDSTAFNAASPIVTEVALSADFTGVDAFTLDSLLSSETYYARLKAVNSAEATGYSAVFTLATQSLEGDRFVKGDGSSAAPGLLQVYHSGLSLDWTVDDTEGAASVQPGVVAAALGSDNNIHSYWASNGYNGQKYIDANGDEWVLGSNYSYGYRGYMFMEAGAAYNFFEHFEDSARLSIDGADVIRDTTYTATAVGTYSCLTTGWHEVTVHLAGSSGGRGCRSGWKFAFGWNKNGVTTVDDGAKSILTGWDMLLNGDGDEFLWTSPPARYAEIVRAVPDAENDAIDLEIYLDAAPGGLAPTELWAVCGAQNGGTDTNYWDRCFRLNGATTYDAAAQTAEVSFSGVSGVRYVRVFAKGADGSIGWSDVAHVNAAAPIVSGVSVAHDGDRAVVSFNIDSIGAGGISTTVMHATDSSFSGAAEIEVRDATAAGPYSVEIDCEPGVPNYAKVVVVDSDDNVTAVDAAMFVPLAGSSFPTAASRYSTDGAHHAITFKANMMTVGAGTNLVTLWTGDSPDTLAANGDPFRVDTTDAFSVTRTFTGVPRTIYYQFVAINTAPGGTAWTNSSPIAHEEFIERTSYTWKEGVADGYWNDPDNWTATSYTDNAVGYPCITKGSNDGWAYLPAGCATTFRISGAQKGSHIKLVGTGTDILFLGVGDGASLHADFQFDNNNSAYTNSTWTFANLAVSDRDTFDNGLGGALSSNLTLRFTGSTVNLPQGSGGVNGLAVKAVDSRILIEDGSAATAKAASLESAGAVLSVDSSTLTLTSGGVTFDASGDHAGIAVAIAGAGARITSSNGEFCNVGGKAVENDVAVKFAVPAGGFAAAPLYSEGTNCSFAEFSGDGNTGKILISLDSRSPVFAGNARTSVPLIEWKGGVDTNNVSTVASRRADYRYTYGWPSTLAAPENEGDLPTGLWADTKPASGLVFFLR
ncbi:MAG: hypothetical protein IJ829_07620, partial [Kiritimatiellae bacterium]|nr:hypothetical protein [Kiritimatiellia bacterium]